MAIASAPVLSIPPPVIVAELPFPAGETLPNTELQLTLFLEQKLDHIQILVF